MLLGLYQLLTHLYRDEEKALRTSVRSVVKEALPGQEEKFSETIGLFHYGAGRGASVDNTPPGDSVILIHGLDDPGKVWQDLNPVLVKEGYDVWQLEYPNDQPLVESADLFFQELHILRSGGVDEITIIAHSMGGLITRDLLTSSAFDYYGAIDAQRVPMVKNFIMVGTPNHGSAMVKLRFFAEVRDHFTRLIKGQTNILNFIFDGAGEAKIDLLPGSRFLQELNSRPYPENVEQLIIAGVTSPWDQEELTEVINQFSDKLPGISEQGVDALKAALASMTDGLGDGLVSVESTRLPGIPHLTVRGTHLTMIRNMAPDSDRIPPAVPIIIDYLGDQYK